MSEVTIRAGIKTELDAISGIGKVYNRLRWANDWQALLKLFKTVGDKINAWMITRIQLEAETSNKTNDTATHKYKIIGFYGFRDADATEIVFNALIESIRAAFRANYKLSGAAFDTEPMQVAIIDLREFGGVLCHYCELTYEAQELENWS